MFISKRHILRTFLPLLFCAAVFVVPEIGFAQVDNLGAVNEAAGLGDGDLRITIARIIRTFLSVLGVLLVCIILYGGFVWMTAGGDPAKVERAKKILLNSVIGFIVIFLSWSITTFIMTSILNSIQQGGSGSGGNGGNGSLGGGGFSSALLATKIVPEGEIPIRNPQVQVTFNRLLDSSLSNNAISVVNVETGEEVAGAISVTGSRMSFTPASACPSPNEGIFCFDEFTEYEVQLNEAVVVSSGGVSLSCTVANPCTQRFTTGDLVDTEDPTVQIRIPENNDLIPSGLTKEFGQLVSVVATDDSGVAVADFSADEALFDSIAAEGEDLQDVTIETRWETLGLTHGAFYQLSVTVTDLAGNATTDSIRIKATPAHCFDGVQNEDETGLDCGGLCGACAGDVCTDDSDCSGSCVNGFCVAEPSITSFSPANGAPGTFVTLKGNNFGVASGVVTFQASAGGRIEAEIPACTAGWGPIEVTVEVPFGATSGPIELTGSNGFSNTTTENFVVDSTIRPNVCAVTPRSGSTGGTVQVIGNNFGAGRIEGSSVVRFGDSEVRIYGPWEDERIETTVPVLNEGIYQLTVEVDGVTSNAVNFTARDSGGVSPVITSALPASGAVGQYVTIQGSNFGSSVQSVWFEHRASDDRILANVDFPAVCGTNFWKNTQVTVIVPDGVVLGEYDIVLTTTSGSSNAVPFTVTTDPLTPGICAVEPEVTVIGEEVRLIGANFGNNEGSVLMFGTGEETMAWENADGAMVELSASVAEVSDWSNGEVTVIVPENAQTGPLQLFSSSNASSNLWNVEVSGSATDSEVESGVAEYAWYFSTGALPIVPRMIFACNDSEVSGVPNRDFDDPVCINAKIYGSFTTSMDESSLQEGVRVYVCNNEDCTNRSAVEGSLTVAETDGETPTTSFHWVPISEGNRFEPSTNYFVELSDTITSIEQVPLQSSVSWRFSTSSSLEDCEIDKVMVSPSKKTLNELNQTTEFDALAISGACIVLNSAGYDWRWSSTASISRVTSDSCGERGGNDCAVVEALAEGEGRVTASVGGFSSNAALKVKFKDPYILNYWPNCDIACVNAGIGATFNTAMKSHLVQATGAVRLYSCANELCGAGLTEVVGTQATCTLENGECKGFTITLPSDTYLAPKTYYKVIVDGAIQSTSGVQLTRRNDGANYSWKFLTRENGEVCSVNRISLSPDTANMIAIDQMQPFTVSAFGEADACSVAGQKLNARNYNWDWQEIVNDAGVAHWFTMPDGGLIDSDIGSIPEGCTGGCVPEGSSVYPAVCRNGVIEQPHEECEFDAAGNAFDRAGNPLPAGSCSTSCLLTGTQACSDASGVGCCGNGILEAGEQCDDGNAVAGDGCSAVCLNEGSAALGLTCGDGIVTHDSALGGETCDDGNRSSGDGCSALCLSEGSKLTHDVPAVCGNGVVESPYETCDFDAGGNVIGVDGLIIVDGTCSSKCLLQNNEMSVYTGSSITYSSPSICGDGFAGTGEFPACEIGVAGNGRIDPVQIAVISKTAALQVDPQTKKATGTVSVGYEGLTAEATISLSCVAESDDDCPLGYGPDENGCCSLRPEATMYPNHENACRNSSIYAVFAQEMDVQSFPGNAYVKLELQGPRATCPEGHIISNGLALRGDRPLLARVWDRVRFWFGASLNAQEAGECLLPITEFKQSLTSSGEYRVNFLYNVALAENATYTIVLKTDTLGDDRVDGVTSAIGVGISSRGANQIEQVFTTSAEVCGFDAVEVIDTNEQTPNFFSTFDEPHVFSARAISYAGGKKQEIHSIPGVYAWNWQEWKEDSGASIVSVSGVGDATEAIVTSQRLDGETTVIATAEITQDVVTGRQGTIISGTGPAVVLLCESPWPSHDFFPFIDDETSTLPGVVRGAGWMNFSTYYCRDRASGNDLPALSVVAPPQSGTSSVIKEYLFRVASTPDAIGVRIAPNPNFLHPRDWYRAQGFSGNPTDTTVDGFTAVQEGRTTYIAAPNEDKNSRSLYSNIYIISYNEGARQETIQIYNQFLSNLTLATNVEGVNLCRARGGYTDTICTTDLDCNQAVGEVCGAGREKLQRDMTRLIDVRQIEATLENFAQTNRVCNLTVSQSCSTSADCPSGESCIGTYPSLDAGTFVRSLTSSGWSSWNESLESQIGALPQDPLNRYNQCGPGTTYANYDANTCVNSELGQYVCTAGSHVYHYRSSGPFGYQLSAELEYKSASNSGWVNDIDRDLSDNKVIKVGNALRGSGNGFQGTAAVCNDMVHGDSAVCGDGIVGPGEVCEIGERGAGGECSLDDGTLGRVSTVCNATCTGFVDDPSAVCVPFACGNGVVEVGEECDDGSFNGRYGYCGNDCTYDTAFYCGDGSLAGGEVCDCGVDSVSGRAFGGGSCTVANGVYSANASNTCAWNCAGPAPHCGDGVVSNGEQCDGGTQTYNGKLCGGSGTERDFGTPCDENNQCSSGICGSAGRPRLGWTDACPVSTVCLNGDADKVGTACGTNTDCGTGGVCSTFTTETTRTKTCTGDCTWGGNSWRGLACKALGSCGDGVIDPGEQCDDGSANGPNSACTNLCTLNVCGDGFLLAGVEQCDTGANNGIACTAEYGSTCNYCSSSCQLLTSSGAFCGDGVINGAEFCDASDLPYQYMNNSGARLGACSVLGQQHPTQPSYICGNIGLCNGGARNGEVCATGASASLYSGNFSCGGYECVLPKCGAECSASCPFTLASNSVLMLDNQVGATRSSAVSLLSYEASLESTVLGAANAATIYFPACRVMDELVVNVSDRDRVYPDTEIIFVLDKSKSMKNYLGELITAVNHTIDNLFDAYEGTGSTMKIGLAYVGGEHGDNSNGDGAYQSGEYYDFKLTAMLGDASDRDSLKQLVVDNFSDTANEVGTPLYKSIDDARRLFTGINWSSINSDSPANIDQIMVIFRDGLTYNTDYDLIDRPDIHIFDPDNDGYDDGDYVRAVSSITSAMKNRGVKVFTATFTSGLATLPVNFDGTYTKNYCAVQQMAHWSSATCTPNPNAGCENIPQPNSKGRYSEGNYTCSASESGTEYAFHASDANGISEMYQEIVDAILNVSVSVTVGGETAVTAVPAGVNKSIKLPSTFTCNPTGETSGTLRLNFSGEGLVEISNASANMCNP